MSHFGSNQWPSLFGTVYKATASIDAINLGAVGASPVTGSTEGTDKHTYSVLETGLYLVAAALHTDVASDAGTSQTLACQVAYNNGAAQAAADLGEASGGGSATVAHMDTTTINTELGQMGVIRAEAGTDIVVTTLATNGGTVATVGDIDIDVSIVRLA